MMNLMLMARLMLGSVMAIPLSVLAQDTINNQQTPAMFRLCQNLQAQFTLAELIHRKNNDPSGEADILNKMGAIQINLREYSKALELYQQALKIYKELLKTNEKLGNHAGVQETVQRIENMADELNSVGRRIEDLGQYQRAIEFIQLSLAIYEELRKPLKEASSLNFLGWLYFSLGQYQQTIELNQKSLAIHRDAGDSDGYALSLADMGLAYQGLGQYEQAIELAQQALSIARATNNAELEAFVLNDLGNAYYSISQYKKALEFHQQAIASYPDRFHRWAVVSLNDLGKAHQALGEYQQAMKFYLEALRISRDKRFRAVEGTALNSIADLLNKQNQPELAIVFYKQSVNVIEEIRRDIQGLPREVRQSFTQTVAGTYRALADLLLKQDRVLEAQRVLDLLKVQEIDDYLRNVRGNDNSAQGVANTPSEQQIRQGYDLILDQAIALGKELTQLQRIPPSDRTPTQQQRILELRKAEQQITQEFQDFLKSPAVQTLISQLRQTTSGHNFDLENARSLQDNLQRLQQNAVILYPLILDDRLELVIVTPDSPPIRRTVAVTRSDLNKLIVEFRSALTNPFADARIPAQKLYNYLIKPLEKDLAQAEAQTIIYAPDGQLRYIPLAALYDGKQWLIQRFRINNITALSLTDFNTQPQSQLQVFAGAFTEGSYRFNVGEQEFSFQGLPFAGREVENLAAAIPQTTKRLNQQFDRKTVLLMNDYSVVHLATHAAFVVGKPEDSFILFGNGDRATLRDVEKWTLPKVDLVVLSACETGVGGKLGNGEEILGFGYQMQRTGARAAIASLWSVDDGGTQVLMDAFYAVLKRGNVTKAEALRQAQIALITAKEQGGGQARSLFVEAVPVRLPSGASRPLSHPYYWAPFILIGNGL